MRFVDLEEARGARGLRLVVQSGVPSPWSEGAKGCFDITGVDYVALRLRPGDDATRAWTGHGNAPVALYDDEPPRAGWAEILALAERIAPAAPLLPAAPQQRVEALGLCHEVLGEGGLVWCARFLLIHAGLETGGQRGFAPRIASYLAPKYGYAAGGPAAAHARVRSLLSLFGERLGSGRDYFFEDRPTALDVYLASAVGVFHPLSESDCPMLPAIRQAYETTDPELQAAVGPALLAHRDRMYGRHLPLPVQL